PCLPHRHETRCVGPKASIGGSLALAGRECQRPGNMARAPRCQARKSRVSAQSQAARAAPKVRTPYRPPISEPTRVLSPSLRRLLTGQARTELRGALAASARGLLRWLPTLNLTDVRRLRSAPIPVRSRLASESGGA